MYYERYMGLFRKGECKVKQLVDEFKDTGKWYTELAFEYPE